MSWITPTPEQCKARLQKEWAAVANAAKASGETVEAVVQRVIDQQVTRVRGRVPSSVKLGPEGTIPDEMLSSFLALWVYEFLTALPGMRDLLDDLRVKAWEAAKDELRELAMGRVRIVAPTEIAPDAQQAAGPGVEVARQARPVQDLRTAGLL